MAFWTDKDVEPLQKYRYRVVTNLWIYPSIISTPKTTIPEGKLRSYRIPTHLISSVDLPGFELQYENISAKLSLESDIQGTSADLGELSLKLIMTPRLMGDIPRMVQGYWATPIKSKVPASFEARAGLIHKSNIKIYFYNSSGEIVRTLGYYRVQPIGYKLGDIKYGDSDVIEGEVKFYYESTTDASGKAPKTVSKKSKNKAPKPTTKPAPVPATPPKKEEKIKETPPGEPKKGGFG